jgi:hypothetical protein
MGNYQGKHYKKYRDDVFKEKTLSIYNKITDKLVYIIDTYDNFVDNLDNKVRGQVCLKVDKKMQSRERNAGERHPKGLD